MDPLTLVGGAFAAVDFAVKVAKLRARAAVVTSSTHEATALLKFVESELLTVRATSASQGLPTKLRSHLGSFEKTLEELQIILLKVRLGKTGWRIRWALRSAEIERLLSNLDVLRQSSKDIFLSPPNEPAPGSSAAPPTCSDTSSTPPNPPDGHSALTVPAAIPEDPDLGVVLERIRHHPVPTDQVNNTDGTSQRDQTLMPSHEGLIEATDDEGTTNEISFHEEREEGSGHPDAEDVGPLGDSSHHLPTDAGAVSSEEFGGFFESWLARAISTPVWVHGLYFSLGLLAIITCGMSLPSGEEAPFTVGPAATIDPGFYSLISQSVLCLLSTFTIIVPLARRDRKMYEHIPVSSPASFRLFIAVAGACAVASGVLAAWSQKLATVVGFVSTAGQLAATLMLIQGTTDNITERSRRIEELEIEGMAWKRLFQASNTTRSQVARPRALRVHPRGN